MSFGTCPPALDQPVNAEDIEGRSNRTAPEGSAVMSGRWADRRVFRPGREGPTAQTARSLLYGRSSVYAFEPLPSVGTESVRGRRGDCAVNPPSPSPGSM